MRVFEDQPAIRTSVPLLLGIVGPSGGGKSYSALRLATGIQAVNGGDIMMIDTESRRGLHYADRFKYRWMAFGAPFSPLDYLAAMEHAVKRGAKTIIIDSMSHEHEGPGGVLEMHREDTKELAAKWRCSEEKAQMSAWGRAKGDRRRMLNTMIQMPASFILCFRAKEKLKIKPGEDPKAMGFMPIAGEEIVYEMMVNFLLLPRADGVPVWSSENLGEQLTMKLPVQFKSLFGDGEQLCEAHGTEMALWAGGRTAKPGSLTAELASRIEAATTTDELETVVAAMQKAVKEKALTRAEVIELSAIGRAKREALNPPNVGADPAV